METTKAKLPRVFMFRILCSLFFLSARHDYYNHFHIIISITVFRWFCELVVVVLFFSVIMSLPHVKYLFASRILFYD